MADMAVEATTGSGAAVERLAPSSEAWPVLRSAGSWLVTATVQLVPLPEVLSEPF
jgi:hypothetical protein